MAEVPCEHAITRSGASWASAPNSMSQTRCEISWLAYTTGAGDCACTTEPGSATSSTGGQQPELGGTRSRGSATILIAVKMPEAVTASGAFIGPATCGSVP